MHQLSKREVTIPALDEELMRKAQIRLDQLTKPLGSLGRLETLAKQVVGMTRSMRPSLSEKAIVTMAADHGVVEEGVSAYPQAVTKEMVANFLRGGAGINVLARHIGARVVVVDMGVAADLAPHPGLVVRKIGYGTKNLARGPAMTQEEAYRAVQAGLEIVAEEIARGMDIVGTGDMGIGNTTSSSAIAAAITGKSPALVTGHGTGISQAMHQKKVQVIEQALEVNRPDPADPMDLLAKLGGFEIAGLVGMILGAANARRPVVIDGFISGAATLIAVAMEPKVKPYLIASHLSQEPGHRLMLEYLGLEPILDLGLRLGEGTGAALAMSIVEAACRVFNEMATFEQAGVSGKER